jgi:hypothetical protein
LLGLLAAGGVAAGEHLALGASQFVRRAGSLGYVRQRVFVVGVTTSQAVGAIGLGALVARQGAGVQIQ